MLEQEQKMQSINKHNFKHLQFMRFNYPKQTMLLIRTVAIYIWFLIQFRLPSTLENCRFQFSVNLEVHRNDLQYHQTAPFIIKLFLPWNLDLCQKILDSKEFSFCYLHDKTWYSHHPIHHNLSFLALTKRVTSRHSDRSWVAQALHVHHKCSVYCVSCSITCFFEIQRY